MPGYLLDTSGGAGDAPWGEHLFDCLDAFFQVLPVEPPGESQTDDRHEQHQRAEAELESGNLWPGKELQGCPWER